MNMNPIIPGFAPDPSAVRVGDTYFLVNSSFHIFPGLPIYASKDLVSWKHIGNALNRQSQLSLALSSTRLNSEDGGGDLMCATGGLYAPTIRHHDDIFYVICTNVIHVSEHDGTHQNFIISTADIWSNQWSDPVFFDFDGIDTSILWDDDGRSYMHGSAAPGPMTTIKLFAIDVKTGKKLSDEKIIWRGTGGIWPEGPHIYKTNDGWHYLVISEGGTFEDHMITVARSKSIWGPYEANPGNPILTARGTDEYVQHTGHSDIFQDLQGNWWAVCLGVRKDQSKRYVMGRETFLTPIEWPPEIWPTSASINENGKDVVLTPSEYDLCQASPDSRVTFLGKRQRQLKGHSQVAIQSVSVGTQVNAGLCVYKDEHRFARIYLNFETSAIVFEFVNKAKSITRSKKITIDLKEGDAAATGFRLEYLESSYKFAYRLERDSQWIDFGDLDTLELTGHDFVGPIVGIFAFTKDANRRANVNFKMLEIE
uniref:Xylosidase/arabinosidase n=1 Tax=Talaromyces marneffei PM1 TaxID=1077442 RepID=A0A093Y0X2_TALMA